MKIISPDNLYTADYSIDDISLSIQYCKPGQILSVPRNGGKSSIACLLSCDADCTDKAENVTVSAKNGTVLYLPGKEYQLSLKNSLSSPLKAEENQANFNCILITFTLIDEGGTPFELSGRPILLQSHNTSHYLEVFSRIALKKAFYTVPTQLKINLYSFFLDISSEYYLMSANRKTPSSIDAALNYLSVHAFEDIDVPYLANLCEMSVSSFREHFKKETGMSPINYIIRSRVEKAKSLLENGAFSVGEVAHAVGMSDVLYFSRFYKKNTGVCPSEVLKKSKKANYRNKTKTGESK